MKNIHIIPTDKPSRLFITEGKLFNYHKPQEGDGIKIINQNIYITNDEEPKDGDWVIEYIFDNLIFKVYSTTSEFVKKSKFHSLPRNHCKKIILTTDTDLIADGVQSIPDDFLKWFVKKANDSGKPIDIVVVDHEKVLWEDGSITHHKYQIIIPS